MSFNGRSTSLCYLERDGKYLILHRTKKQHDENGDKWIGKRKLLDEESGIIRTR